MSSTQIIGLVLTVIAVIIYNDAATQKIGKIKGEKSLLNISAGGWGACTIFLAIGAVPLYLSNRSKLIAKAKSNPVTIGTTRRITVSIVLLIVGLASVYVTTSLHAQNG